MAYNPTKPADTDLVKKSAELIRENLESLRKDGIVFAKPPLYDAGEPKASTGENGDRYIDTMTGNQYYKNTAGQWEQTLVLDDKYKAIKDVDVLQSLISAVEEKLQQATRSFESYSPYMIGEYKLMALNNVPASTGFVKSTGGLYSIAKYPNAYALFGIKHGGDGVNTFAVPDWRADAIRINDDGRNVDSARVLGSEQVDAVKSHAHRYRDRYYAQYSGANGMSSVTYKESVPNGNYNANYGPVDNDWNNNMFLYIDSDTSKAGDNETRMRNRSCCMYVYIGIPGIDA